MMGLFFFSLFGRTDHHDAVGVIGEEGRNRMIRLRGYWLRESVRQCWQVAAGVLFLMVFISASAAAEEEAKRFDLSAAYLYSIPIGEEESGTNWSDLYENGQGALLEFAYRVTPHFALYAGTAYHQYHGKELTFGSETGRFNDQTLLSLYAGIKAYLLAPELPQKAGGINPYLRVDIGATQYNGAAFNGASVADRSVQFAYSVGVGADLLTYTSFIFFLEAKYEDHGTPDKAGSSFRAVPIAIGVRYLM